MKKNLKAVKAAEPAPVDSIEVADKKDVLGLMAFVFDTASDMEDRVNDAVNKLEKAERNTKKMMIGGAVLAAIGIATALASIRKE